MAEAEGPYSVEMEDHDFLVVHPDLGARWTFTNLADAQEIADALNAREKGPQADAVAPEIIARALAEHDCPEDREAEAPEEITVYAFPVESLVRVYDDAETWESEGEHFSLTEPAPVTLLAWPCGLITDPRDPEVALGGRPTATPAPAAIPIPPTPEAIQPLLRALVSAHDRRQGASWEYGIALAPDAPGGSPARTHAHEELQTAERHRNLAVTAVLEWCREHPEALA